MLGNLRFSEMRRQHRERLADRRDALRLGFLRVRSRDDMRPRRLGSKRGYVRDVPLRGCDRGGALPATAATRRATPIPQRKPARLFAEIGQRRRSDAFEVAAERRQPQIELQNFRLSTTHARVRVRGPSGAACRLACVHACRRASERPASSASSRRRRCARARTICSTARTTAFGSMPWWL